MHSTERDWITTPITADLLRGALDAERTAHGLLPHRLPARARAQVPDEQLAMAEAQPSGVRLVFRTGATAVELDTLPTKRVYTGAPPRPDGVYDLLVDGRLAGRSGVTGGNTVTIDLRTGATETRPGPPGTLRFTGLGDGAKDVEIWLPHNETTELVALRTDAPIEPVPDRGRKMWLHHGSSISHGSDAASPTTTWPALAASLGGVELINLGLSGSALLDPFIIHEETPGPSLPDFSALAEGRLRFRAGGDPAERASGKLTLGVVRDALARIVEQRAAEDPNLHYLDGRDLYGRSDFAELPLPDGLHPDAATHRRIGERFAGLALTADGPFAERGRADRDTRSAR